VTCIFSAEQQSQFAKGTQKMLEIYAVYHASCAASHVLFEVALFKLDIPHRVNEAIKIKARK
jgi:hypothetical protein